MDGETRREREIRDESVCVLLVALVTLSFSNAMKGRSIKEKEIVDNLSIFQWICWCRRRASLTLTEHRGKRFLYSFIFSFIETFLNHFPIQYLINQYLLGKVYYSIDFDLRSNRFCFFLLKISVDLYLNNKLPFDQNCERFYLKKICC